MPDSIRAVVDMNRQLSVSTNIVWHRATVQLAEFTGITSPLPMKPPENCELIVHTDTTELDVCVQQVIDKMMQCSIITTDSFGMNNIASIFGYSM